MASESGQRRVIPTADAPEEIRRLAGRAEAVVEWTNPDGSVVYWFVVDGQETRVPPGPAEGES